MCSVGEKPASVGGLYFSATVVMDLCGQWNTVPVTRNFRNLLPSCPNIRQMDHRKNVFRPIFSRQGQFRGQTFKLFNPFCSCIIKSCSANDSWNITWSTSRAPFVIKSRLEGKHHFRWFAQWITIKCPGSPNHKETYIPTRLSRHANSRPTWVWEWKLTHFSHIKLES